MNDYNTTVIPKKQVLPVPNKVLGASGFPLLQVPVAKPSVVPKDADMALQDPPIEPVYSASPAVLKAGLAAALAALGFGG